MKAEKFNFYFMDLAPLSRSTNACDADFWSWEKGWKRGPHICILNVCFFFCSSSGGVKSWHIFKIVCSYIYNACQKEKFPLRCFVFFFSFLALFSFLPAGFLYRNRSRGPAFSRPLTIRMRDRTRLRLTSRTPPSLLFIHCLYFVIFMKFLSHVSVPKRLGMRSVRPASDFLGTTWCRTWDRHFSTLVAFNYLFINFIFLLLLFFFFTLRVVIRLT